MSIDSQKILSRAEQIKSEIIAYRREIHRCPEVGTTLPRTKEYVKKRLSQMGYEPVEIC